MINIFKNIEIKFTNFSKNTWVISLPNSKYLHLDENSYNLLYSVYTTQDIATAFRLFVNKSDINIDKASFEKIAELKVSEIINVAKQERDINYKPDYLFFSKDFINENSSEIISAKLVFLFRKEVLIPIIIISILINSWNWYYFNPFQAKQSFTQYIVSIIILLLSTLVHEFGHISACKSYNLKPGNIGAGFYYFMPVAYSDVTEIWKLPKKQRIMVNVGGIYFQIMYSGILLLFSVFISESILKYSAFLIFISALFQLNPLLRFDGYWILSDFLDIPNLHKKSIELVKRLTKGTFTKAKQSLHLTRKDFYLLIYWIANSAMFVFIMVSISKGLLKDIINLPLFLYNSVLSINYLKQQFTMNYIFALMFYFIVIDKVLKRINKQ